MKCNVSYDKVLVFFSNDSNMLLNESYISTKASVHLHLKYSIRKKEVAVFLGKKYELYLRLCIHQKLYMLR